MSQRYQRCAHELRRSQSAGVEQFQPTSSERLSYFLRLSDGIPASGLSLLEPWNAISEKFGHYEAFRRLSGLPVAMTKEIASTLPDDELSRILNTARTPLAAAHAAVLCRLKGLDYQPMLRRFIETSEKYSSLFGTILRWTEQAFRGQSTWWRAPTAERLALIWSHADRILDILIWYPADPKEAQDFFLEHDPPQTFADRIRADRVLGRDRASPSRYPAEALILHGLNYILEGAAVAGATDADTAAAINAGVTTENGEARSPSLAAIYREAELSDHLASILSGRPADVLEGELDPSVVRRAQREQALVALETEPSSPTAWLGIFAYAYPTLPQADRDRLNAAAAATSLNRVAELAEDSRTTRVALEALVESGEHDADDFVFSKVREFAVALAGKHGGRFDRNDPVHAADFHTLFECAALVARHPMPEVSVENLARALKLIVGVWPAIASQVRGIIDSMLRMEPPAETGALWGLYLSLRTA